MHYIYNFIGPINNESTAKLLGFIKDTKDITSLTININSTGGDVSCAVALYHYLKTQKFHIQTHNLCDVLSAAIVLYLVGSDRTAESDCKFLIHPISLNVNDIVNYNKALELLNAINTDIANYSAIVNRETTNMNNKYEIEHLLKNESIYLCKEEAFECGIVTNR